MLVYPLVTSAAARLVACKSALTTSGGSVLVLREQPTVQCYTGVHSIVGVCAWVCLATYSFALPALGLWLSTSAGQLEAVESDASVVDESAAAVRNNLRRDSSALQKAAWLASRRRSAVNADASAVGDAGRRVMRGGSSAVGSSVSAPLSQTDNPLVMLAGRLPTQMPIRQGIPRKQRSRCGGVVTLCGLRARLGGALEPLWLTGQRSDGIGALLSGRLALLFVYEGALGVVSAVSSAVNDDSLVVQSAKLAVLLIAAGAAIAVAVSLLSVRGGWCGAVRAGGAPNPAARAVAATLRVCGFAAGVVAAAN